MRILIGTNNKNKIKQYTWIFKKFFPLDVEILSLLDVGIKDDVEEDADNLMDNAKKKAIFYGKKSGISTVSDDTGLFIDALDGAPGLHAKRWMVGDDMDRAMKVLELMENIPYGDRTARYKGAVAIYDPSIDQLWSHESNIEGKIAYDYVDGGGFGYDPIFITDKFNKRYAFLTEEEIFEINHRGMSIREYARFLKN